jgi:hypothetical protein
MTPWMKGENTKAIEFVYGNMKNWDLGIHRAQHNKLDNKKYISHKHHQTHQQASRVLVFSRTATSFVVSVRLDLQEMSYQIGEDEAKCIWRHNFFTCTRCLCILIGEKCYLAIFQVN